MGKKNKAGSILVNVFCFEIDIVNASSGSHPDYKIVTGQDKQDHIDSTYT